jgi:RNA polymerase sigma factor (sigma-70 family)
MIPLANRSPDDDELFSLFQNTRNERHFEELFRRHSRVIYTYCCLLLRDPARAEEIAQDVFLRALKHSDQYRGGCFRAWLRTIALNLCRNEIQRLLATARNEESACAEIHRNSFVPQSDMSAESLLSEVGAALRRLSPEHSQMLKLRYFDDYSYEQIACLLGENIGFVRSKLQRAKINFRKVWESRGRGAHHG